MKKDAYRTEFYGSFCRILMSDIGHGYYGPETGDRVPESNPGPTKKIMCKARGLNPGLTKKIVRTIMHVIAKYDRTHHRKILHAYEIRAHAQTNSMWNMSAGRRTTATPTKKWTTDRPF